MLRFSALSSKFISVTFNDVRFYTWIFSCLYQNIHQFNFFHSCFLSLVQHNVSAVYRFRPIRIKFVASLKYNAANSNAYQSNRYSFTEYQLQEDPIYIILYPVFIQKLIMYKLCTLITFGTLHLYRVLYTRRHVYVTITLESLLIWYESGGIHLPLIQSAVLWCLKV